MSDLAKNNLEAQTQLMKDVLQNYKNITYSVTTKGLELRKLLDKKQKKEGERNVILDIDVYEAIYDIVCNLSDERKFYKLGILAENSVPDNEIKLKILATLQK